MKILINTFLGDNRCRYALLDIEKNCLVTDMNKLIYSHEIFEAYEHNLMKSINLKSVLSEKMTDSEINDLFDIFNTLENVLLKEYEKDDNYPFYDVTVKTDDGMSIAYYKIERILLPVDMKQRQAIESIFYLAK